MTTKSNEDLSTALKITALLQDNVPPERWPDELFESVLWDNDAHASGLVPREAPVGTTLTLYDSDWIPSKVRGHLPDDPAYWTVDSRHSPADG